ncbi:MAG: DUF1348 family protein [Planctomycetes bacterium]|nr:DUF1348 family protein [Planctomycetota bacterium]
MSVVRSLFTLETALAKVRAAEDAWIGCDLIRASLAYLEGSERRNRNATCTNFRATSPSHRR